MAAEAGTGSGSGGGGRPSDAMERVLPVLLLPLPAAPGSRVGARARLHGGQEALGSLAAPGALHLLSLAPGGRRGGGGGRSLTGPFRHFVWENTENPILPTNKPKLLTLGENSDLLVHEFNTEDGKCEVTTLHRCNGETLKKLIEDKNISVDSIQSVRVLSFHSSTALLLINEYIVLHVAFPEGGMESGVRHCFPLSGAPRAMEGPVETQLCRGILFVLDRSGWMYMFDSEDGMCRAQVDLTTLLTDGSEDPQPSLSPSSASLTVSRDLDVVIVSRSHSAVALDLDLYFRQHPEHLLWERRAEDLPVEGPPGSDEDDLANSAHNMKLMKFSFPTDRSWKAQLLVLSDVAKRTPTDPESCGPWFLHLPHVEPSESSCSGIARQTEPLAPAHLVWARPDCPEKEPARGRGLGRQWKREVHFRVPAEPSELRCVCVTRFSALFTLAEESTGLTVALWDLETQEVKSLCLGRGCIPVDGGEDQQLCLVLTEDGLCLVLFGLTQEEFLNRLMIHGSAGTVDAVCRLNAWGRCPVPIHALEAGIENRQLDTVDFFLKSKENLLTPSASPSSSLTDPFAGLPSQEYLKRVQELIPALDLLCSAVRENDLETQSKHFSEQLLNLTLSFLHKQLREIFVHIDELDGPLQAGVDILTGYITELRTFMIKFPKRPVDTVGASGAGVGLSDPTPTGRRPEAWEGLSPEQVITDAILNNKIPEAQAFFRVTGHAAQNLEQLIQTGLGLAYNRLLEKNVEEASRLLRNMGFDVKAQLHKICFYTTEKALRDFLVGVLQEENDFSEEEKRTIEFVRQVETLYMGPGEENREPKCPSRCWSKERDLPRHKCILDSVLGEPEPEDEPSEPERRLMLSWAERWDPPTREAVLLPRITEDELRSCTPEVLWAQLTSRHDWPNILSWIGELQPQDGPAPLQPARWPPLTADVIDQHTLCSGYMRNEILDKLARRGVFVASELDDFDLLLARLSRIGGVMQDPLPVQNYRSQEGLDFHSRFLLHCLEHSLQHLLYVYLDHHGLSPENFPFLENKDLHEAYPWFEFLVCCRQVSRSPPDPKLIFQASLANAQILIPSNQASVSSMLLEGRTLLALATTMFAPGGLTQREERESCWKKVDPQLLKMALAPYPKLRAALFPQSPAHGSPPHDITLYHLLQALLPFDPARLFGWQPTNTLAIGDSMSQLPHFSSPELVSKYALTERLDFAYYLRHGRPSFAFGSLLVQDLAKSKSPKQLIQQAGHEAYTLGLASFHVASVGAACVCFLELLGLDSRKLRVDLKVANTILNHRCRNDEARPGALRESLAAKLAKLADGDLAAAEELLALLEEGIWDGIQQQEIQRTSSDSRCQWALAVQFCKLHGLRPSPSYLRACAQTDDWLRFIVHSQLHGFRPEEVMPLLGNFSPVLRDHLQLALENLAPLSGDPVVPRDSTGREGASDAFQALLRCPEGPGAWHGLLAEAVRQRAPALSVLAACFQDAGIIPCLCAWIVTSVDEATAAEAMRALRDMPVEAHDWGLDVLAAIWRTLLERQKSQTLSQSARLFLKDSPLLPLAELYELGMEAKRYSDAKARLEAFQTGLAALKAVAPVTPAPVPSTVPATIPAVVPAPWLEAQFAFLLKLMLQQCRTQYELRKLLQLFAEVEHPPPDGPDLKKLCELSQILKETSIVISPAVLASYSPENFERECRSILEKLQGDGQFALARKVAELAELPVDSLVVEEVVREMQTLERIGQWALKQARLDFWKKCHDRFTGDSVSDRAVADFFSGQARAAAELPEGASERHLLLTLAGRWLARGDPVPVGGLQELERQIWLCRIARRVSCGAGEAGAAGLSRQISTSGEMSFDSLADELSFSQLEALNTPDLLAVEGLPAPGSPPGPLDGSQQEALRALVGDLLDRGRVHEASRACRYFRLHHRDVFLALHCQALASGDAADLHPQVHALLRGPSPLLRERGQSVSSEDSESFVVVPAGDEILADLEMLTSQCLHGKSYCRRVVCLYELAKELGRSYREVAAQDPAWVLRAILSSRWPTRCQKARAFIAAQGVPSDVVAELVAEEVTRELLAGSRGRAGQKQMSDQAEDSLALLQLTALCQDHTSVGTKLLDKISSVPHGELSCTTELLILAHHCFTLTCHMEGITRVLQAARLLTDNHLAPNEEFGLVVRLLTGIGRYQEMTYIFDLLHRKHYFEVLMRKKLDSSGTLKTALLDYIKRCRPGDSEKHNMIALCFSMCRQIGENHEAAARIQLKLIESRPWEECIRDGPQLKQLLLKALTLMLDAAESYAKDSCVRQALRCRRLTRLLTLQIHFLNTGRHTRLINLSRPGLVDCVLALPRFYQASIVAEAYDFTPDWAEVLFQHVVLGGDFGYLEEFKQQQPLKPSLFEEISKKFGQQQPPTDEAVRNLKKLFGYCEDIYLRYRLAYDHQFYDLVNSLLKDPQTGCCLKDLLVS
ncbi:spatacsin isoform X3 [Ornithorhynchus anatinus]|uniref:spatacsin isoform X3 n=1 Tax=Ornithorhynchus anatinus TaxID=9258 RepID=UPI0010A8FB48|nr:spatacsin isoform X3 [Ornithorhynchus anatinus]